ncbi:hypothetical protein [Sphingobacterium sp. IITKGP-BTPF85]|uniref:hypothetical protein n=1 Tax=Sphingobacterium sp. IITKGP-BTPF85 TaxID=1338009 RepID=UPI000389E564|nr:hypothetical protein [Sphingobacterium sp. IITKGP-BTPF85]
MLLTLKDSYCIPPTYFLKAEQTLPHQVIDSLASNDELNNDFSKQNVLMLYALGLTEEMKELRQLKGDTNVNASIRKLMLNDKINRVLLLALSDINATAAELDCEAERVDQVAGYIDNINDTRNNKLVVGSIALGAVAAIAGTLITNNNVNNAVGIAGGVIGGGLGFFTLNPKGKKVEFNHPHNLLRNVWRQNDNDESFSPFIWYMLSEKEFSNDGNSSLLHNLKTRWIDYQFDSNENQGNQSVIFSDGGIYFADDLHSRAAMINQLQAVIRSINQSINNLILEANKTLE